MRLRGVAFRFADRKAYGTVSATVGRGAARIRWHRLPVSRYCRVHVRADGRVLPARRDEPSPLASGEQSLHVTQREPVDENVLYT